MQNPLFTGNERPIATAIILAVVSVVGLAAIVGGGFAIRFIVRAMMSSLGLGGLLP